MLNRESAVIARLAHHSVKLSGKPSWESRVRSCTLCGYGENLWCHPHSASLPLYKRSPGNTSGLQRSPAALLDGRRCPANQREVASGTTIEFWNLDSGRANQGG